MAGSLIKNYQQISEKIKLKVFFPQKNKARKINAKLEKTYGGCFVMCQSNLTVITLVQHGIALLKRSTKGNCRMHKTNVLVFAWY